MSTRTEGPCPGPQRCLPQYPGQKNLGLARGLLRELREKYPSYRRATELGEGIIYWLSRAYRPVVEELQDLRGVETLWSASFKDIFQKVVNLYRQFIHCYEKGLLTEAILVYSQLRDEVRRSLLKPSPREERLTLYLTDINLERLEPGLSVALNERFPGIEGTKDLEAIGLWVWSLLVSATRYFPEIEAIIPMVEGFREMLKTGEIYKARERWCEIKAHIGRIKESRQAPSLILFDAPAERLDAFFFTVSPITPGGAEGYIRVFERLGEERLVRILNDPVKGIRGGDVAVLEYLPEIAELQIFPEAFIVERGSVGSHTAKVAAEFGIPAVRMEGATRRFREGERVVVKVSPALDKAEVIPTVYERVTIPEGKATPFMAGEAEGMVRLFKGEAEFLQAPGIREIIVIPHLDTKYLDIFATGEGPGGIIVERGGDLTHPMIVVREMLTRLKRGFPILRLEGVFDLLKEGTAIKLVIPEDLGRVELGIVKG